KEFHLSDSRVAMRIGTGFGGALIFTDTKVKLVQISTLERANGGSAGGSLRHLRVRRLSFHHTLRDRLRRQSGCPEIDRFPGSRAARREPLRSRPTLLC